MPDNGSPATDGSHSMTWELSRTVRSVDLTLSKVQEVLALATSLGATGGSQMKVTVGHSATVFTVVFEGAPTARALLSQRSG